jgi:beta-mannanase
VSRAAALLLVLAVTGALGGCGQQKADVAAHARHHATQSGGNPARTSPTHRLKLNAPNFIYFGATVKNRDGQAPFQMSVAKTFEQHAGKGLAIISWGAPWYSYADCRGYCAFSPAEFDTVRAHGSIPFFSWSPPLPAVDGFSDTQITSGSQDAYITAWARAAAAWGHPLFLRFAWEMNGSWFPWAVNHTGVTPAQYIAMWRHVHDLFQRAGATNVTWVWCPNVDGKFTFKPISALYPGNAYVDWTCIDGYNSGDPWLSFGDLYRQTYDEITTAAPSKPVMLAEVSSSEHGGSKAGWIGNMFNVLPAVFPKVQAMLWFDDSDRGPSSLTDWPIESSQSATAAFRQGIASPLYTGNEYGDLSESPIPPPRR